MTKQYRPEIEAHIAYLQESYGITRSRAVYELRGGNALMGAMAIKAIMGGIVAVWLGLVMTVEEEWPDLFRQQTLSGALTVGWLASCFVAYWAQSKALWVLHFILAILIALLVSTLM